MNFKQAIKQDKLDEFIQEHPIELDVPNARERFEKTLEAMARSSEEGDEKSVQGFPAC